MSINTMSQVNSDERPAHQYVPPKTIWSTASDAICGTFNIAAEVAKAAHNTVKMGTTSIDNSARSHAVNSKKTAILSTAQLSAQITRTLNNDETLKAEYDALAAEWDSIKI